MKRPIDIPRLFIEILASIIVAESAVMFLLPIVAPGAGEAAGALLDAGALTVLAGPFILWRVQSAVGRTHRDVDLAKESSPRRLLATTTTVLVFGLIATAFAVRLARTEIQIEAHARFGQLAERMTTEAKRRMELPVYGLKGVRGVYAASKSVERSAFKAFVASRDLAREYPGAMGLGFIKHVPRTDLDSFVATARADGAPDFTVHRMTTTGTLFDNAPDLYVVDFVEPLELNRDSYGCDIGSDPIRRAAAERAVETGELTITSRVTLLQDGKQRDGLLYMLPVYKNGTHPTTPQERVAALDGLVFAPIVLDDVFANLAQVTDGVLDIEVYDGELPDTKTRFYDHDSGIDSAALAYQEHDGLAFAERTTITVGGRTWTLASSAKSAFEATVDHSTPVLLGVGGAILSMLLSAVVWSIGMSRTRAMALARNMTADLASAKAAAEESLRETLALRATLDTHSIISVADPTGRIIDANSAFCAISGYSREELLGKDHRILNSGEHPKDFWVNIWKTIAGGKAWRGEVCNRAKDGGIYWVDSIIAPFVGANGKLEKYVSIRNDITARKLAEQRLTQSEERTRLVIDSAMDAVIAMDIRGIVTHWSAQAERTFGWPSAEALGRTVDALIIPERFRAAHRAGLARFNTSGQTKVSNTRVEVPAIRKDGTEITVELTITPVRSGSGATAKVWFSAFVRDITERKLAEEQLRTANTELAKARVAAEAANRAKSEFLANMSHEIRTPLTAMLGFADLLRDDGDINLAPAQRIQTIDTIRNAGSHLLTVINDILDLSKIEADRMAVERIDTPVVTVLREVESIVRPRAVSKGLSLNFTLATPVPEHMLSDPTRLRQILMNLAGNATKFTESGKITITAQVESHNGHDRVIFDVEDTGPGMSREQAGCLFQAFGQADGTVTRKYGGTGLGLTISRRLANIMGGDVKLLRTEPGKGSCFRLVLPMEPAPGTAMVSSLDAVTNTALTAPSSDALELQGRILLAEDGVDNQRLIAFHLRKAGATVDIAANGVHALTLIDKSIAEGTPYDLLVTDMQMPEMDGYTLARTLRARGSTLAIVALTAHAMAEDRAKCTDAGCDDYATKPINKIALLATCKSWLAKSGGAKAHTMAA